jgi:hypothetical protein
LTAKLFFGYFWALSSRLGRSSLQTAGELVVKKAKQNEVSMKMNTVTIGTGNGCRFKKWTRWFLPVMGVLLLATSAGAADFTSVQSGGWFDPATWGLPVDYPLIGDNVTIGDSYTVSLEFTNTYFLQINNLVLTNGTLSISTASGQGLFAIAGSNSVWTNGTLGGVMLQLGTLNLIGNNGTYTGAVITNADDGVIHQIGNGNFNPFETTIVNSPGGTYDFAGDGTINDGIYNDLATFINQGTLLKSSGVNTSSVSIWFENEGGTIEVDSGTLALPGAAGYPSTNGTFIVATNATLLAGGKWTGEITGSGAGQVLLDSGSLIAYPTLSLDFPDDLFQWTGGNINAENGSSLVTNLGVITLSATDTVDLTTFVNAGLFRQTGTGFAAMAYTASFTNLAGATYDMEADGNFPQGEGHFSNFGLFRKSGGTGISSIADSTFDNYGGTVEADSGTVQFSTLYQTDGVTWLNGGNLTGGPFDFYGGSLTGTGSVTGAVVNASAVVLPGTNSLGALNIVGNYQQQSGGTLDITLDGANAGQFSQLAVSGNASLNGVLNLSSFSGYSPSVGDKFQILSSGSRSGTFKLPPSFPSGISVTYSNSGVYLIVTNTVLWPAQISSPQLVVSHMDFSFPTITNQSYTIQETASLSPTSWMDYSNFTGNGSVWQFAIPVTNAPQQFFRVISP